MHDPMTLAFKLESPIKRKSRIWPEGYRKTWVNIWHVDPEKDGTDDSCGWFMRARHGDQAVLEKIVQRFEQDWDRVFKSDSGHSYSCGYFLPVGQGGINLFSVSGIAVNLFFLAALEVFGARQKAARYVQKNLFEILWFAENPTDSLSDEFTRKFARGCGEKYTQRERDERIRNTAGCIYGWILRDTRPWWKHPRWHVHHWKIQWIFGQKVWRWLFVRCCKCGQRFGFNQSPFTYSDGTKFQHQNCAEREDKVAQEPSAQA